jgi:FixJ family two-component response regulator
MYRELTNAPDEALSPEPIPDDRSIVFVVDDDVSVRESLELLVENAGWRPSLFKSANEFLAMPVSDRPSCLLLDVNLPDLNGLDLQKVLSVDRAGMPIIFISGYGDVPMTVRAMKAGADEFLTKPLDDKVVIEAVRSALERSAVMVERESEIRSFRERYASLSTREREVMAFVVAGLLNKQVAFELGISEVTVKAHRGQVTRKMKARSVPELVNMAAMLGFLEAR